MAAGKKTTVTFRIKPALKEGLRAAAEREHRSIASMVEVMIRDYCKRNDILIAAHGAASDRGGKPPPRSTKK